MFQCLIRKIEVPATPEERVRQALLALMIKKMGYPPENFQVERCLSQYGGNQHRLDILFYSKGDPFLLIECKKDKVTEKAKQQVAGYNYWVKAPLIAVATWGDVETGILTGTSYEWKKGLIPYRDISVPPQS